MATPSVCLSAWMCVDVSLHRRKIHTLPSRLPPNAQRTNEEMMGYIKDEHRDFLLPTLRTLRLLHESLDPVLAGDPQVQNPRTQHNVFQQSMLRPKAFIIPDTESNTFTTHGRPPTRPSAKGLSTSSVNHLFGRENEASQREGELQ